MIPLFISGQSPLFESLVSRAASRIHQAFRPKTTAAHLAHFTLFLQFSMFIQAPFPPVSPSPLLAFLEFLLLNGLSPPTISGYVHSIRSKFKTLGLPFEPLYHHSVSLALRSLHLNVPQLKRTKGIFDIANLSAIVSISLQTPLGFIYAPLFECIVQR